MSPRYQPVNVFDARRYQAPAPVPVQRGWGATVTSARAVNRANAQEAREETNAGHVPAPMPRSRYIDPRSGWVFGTTTRQVEGRAWAARAREQMPATAHAVKPTVPVPMRVVWSKTTIRSNR